LPRGKVIPVTVLGRAGVPARRLVSGGRSFAVERIEDVEPALDYVRNDLRDRYFIGYRPSNPELDGTWRRIEVRTPDRRHVIRTREGYLASPSRD